MLHKLTVQTMVKSFAKVIKTGRQFALSVDKKVLKRIGKEKYCYATNRDRLSEIIVLINVLQAQPAVCSKHCNLL